MDNTMKETTKATDSPAKVNAEPTRQAVIMAKLHKNESVKCKNDVVLKDLKGAWCTVEIKGKANIIHVYDAIKKYAGK